jgi:hypothetical protein
MLPKTDEGMDLGDAMFYAGSTPEQAEKTAALFSFKKYHKRRARSARNHYQFSIMKGYYQVAYCSLRGHPVGTYSTWCFDNVDRFLDQGYGYRGIEQ